MIGVYAQRENVHQISKQLHLEEKPEPEKKNKQPKRKNKKKQSELTPVILVNINKYQDKVIVLLHTQWNLNYQPLHPYIRLYYFTRIRLP